MSEGDELNLQVIEAELRASIPMLQRRALHLSAVWASELLTQIGQAGSDEFDSKEPIDKRGLVLDQRLTDESAVSDSGMLALCYFNLNQYHRARNALLNVQPEEGGHQHALFLRTYAAFLGGEKKKEEERAEKTDPLEQSLISNKELQAVVSELAELRERYGASMNPFLLFLYGVVLVEMERRDEALQMLVESVNAFPWNWSAWKHLATLCKTRHQVNALTLRPHWMQHFFLAEVVSELQLQETEEMPAIIDTLATAFPNSTYVMAQRAMAHYNRREFDTSQTLFEELRCVDRYRVENMDTYSNILYVKEDKAALSFLAHETFKHDKYQPQTCVVVGNYYALKGRHETAITYFNRALRLDAKYLWAWTLIGHEYIELSNPKAALEAYRRAADINPTDCRAWYGLGQTYEMLNMASYALYYFKKAAALRPYDSRMWVALGETWEQLERLEEAIQCYERADANNDREGIALQKLAKIYRKNDNPDLAAQQYKRVLERRGETLGASSTATSAGGSGGAGAGLSEDVTEALQFLAEYAKSRRDYSFAELCATRLLDSAGPTREQAKALLNEVRQLALKDRDDPNVSAPAPVASPTAGSFISPGTEARRVPVRAKRRSARTVLRRSS